MDVNGKVFIVAKANLQIMTPGNGSHDLELPHWGEGLPRQPVAYLVHCITHYLNALDASVTKLSHMEEGRLAGLPDWIMTERRVTLGVDTLLGGVAVAMRPSPALSKNDIHLVLLKTIEDFERVLDSPPTPAKGTRLEGGMPHGWWPFRLLTGLTLVPVDRPDVNPSVVLPGLEGIGGIRYALRTFEPDRAREAALHFWTQAKAGVTDERSALLAVQRVFDRFESIISDTGFAERRVHRYIRDHARVLLPAFTNSFFEVSFRLGDEGGLL